MPISLAYALFLFTILFIVLEFRAQIKNQRRKECIISTAVLLVALVYGADYVLGWELLPNPNFLLKILKPASEAINSFFQIP